MRFYWLSFVDNTRPVGQRFVGATLIQADSLHAALTKTRNLGINPGGECKSAYTDIKDVKELGICQAYIDRLVSKEDIIANGDSVSEWPDDATTVCTDCNNRRN